MQGSTNQLPELTIDNGSHRNHLVLMIPQIDNQFNIIIILTNPVRITLTLTSTQLLFCHFAHQTGKTNDFGLIGGVCLFGNVAVEFDVELYHLIVVVGCAYVAYVALL